MNRTCEGLKHIWEVVISRPQLAEQIKDLEWSKAKEVAKVAKAIVQPSVVSKVINVAKSSSIRELEEYVKKLLREYRKRAIDNMINSSKNNHQSKTSKTNAGDNEEEIEVAMEIKENDLLHLNFMVYPDAYRVIIEALDVASKITGSELRSYNLQVIATEFLSTYSNLRENNLLHLFLRRFEISNKLIIIAIDAETGKIIYGEEYLREMEK